MPSRRRSAAVGAVAQPEVSKPDRKGSTSHCPVCGSRQSESRLNQHLDVCLGASAKKAGLRKSPDSDDAVVTERDDGSGRKDDDGRKSGRRASQSTGPRTSRTSQSTGPRTSRATSCYESSKSGRASRSSSRTQDSVSKDTASVMTSSRRSSATSISVSSRKEDGEASLTKSLHITVVDAGTRRPSRSTSLVSSLSEDSQKSVRADEDLVDKSSDSSSMSKGVASRRSNQSTSGKEILKSTVADKRTSRRTSSNVAAVVVDEGTVTGDTDAGGKNETVNKEESEEPPSWRRRSSKALPSGGNDVIVKSDQAADATKKKTKAISVDSGEKQSRIMKENEVSEKKPKSEKRSARKTALEVVAELIASPPKVARTLKAGRKSAVLSSKPPNKPERTKTVKELSTETTVENKPVGKKTSRTGKNSGSHVEREKSPGPAREPGMEAVADLAQEATNRRRSQRPVKTPVRDDFIYSQITPVKQPPPLVPLTADLGAGKRRLGTAETKVTTPKEPKATSSTSRLRGADLSPEVSGATPTTVAAETVDYAKVDVIGLRILCSDRSLAAGGSKKELIARLRKLGRTSSAPLEDAASSSSETIEAFGVLDEANVVSGKRSRRHLSATGRTEVKQAELANSDKLEESETSNEGVTTKRRASRVSKVKVEVTNSSSVKRDVVASLGKVETANVTETKTWRSRRSTAVNVTDERTSTPEPPIVVEHSRSGTQSDLAAKDSEEIVTTEGKLTSRRSVVTHDTTLDVTNSDVAADENDATTDYMDVDFRSMNRSMLRDWCSKWSLPGSGIKEEIIERLECHRKSAKKSAVAVTADVGTSASDRSAVGSAPLRRRRGRPSSLGPPKNIVRSSEALTHKRNDSEHLAIVLTPLKNLSKKVDFAAENENVPSQRRTRITYRNVTTESREASGVVKDALHSSIKRETIRKTRKTSRITEKEVENSDVKATTSALSNVKDVAVVIVDRNAMTSVDVKAPKSRKRQAMSKESMIDVKLARKEAYEKRQATYKTWREVDLSPRGPLQRKNDENTLPRPPKLVCDSLDPKEAYGKALDALHAWKHNDVKLSFQEAMAIYEQLNISSSERPFTDPIVDYLSYTVSEDEASPRSAGSVLLARKRKQAGPSDAGKSVTACGPSPTKKFLYVSSLKEIEGRSVRRVNESMSRKYSEINLERTAAFGPSIRPARQQSKTVSAAKVVATKYSKARTQKVAPVKPHNKVTRVGVKRYRNDKYILKKSEQRVKTPDLEYTSFVSPGDEYETVSDWSESCDEYQDQDEEGEQEEEAEEEEEGEEDFVTAPMAAELIDCSASDIFVSPGRSSLQDAGLGYSSPFVAPPGGSDVFFAPVETVAAHEDAIVCGGALAEEVVVEVPTLVADEDLIVDDEESLADAVVTATDQEDPSVPASVEAMTATTVSTNARGEKRENTTVSFQMPSTSDATVMPFASIDVTVKQTTDGEATSTTVEQEADTSADSSMRIGYVDGSDSEDDLVSTISRKIDRFDSEDEEKRLIDHDKIFPALSAHKPRQISGILSTDEEDPESMASPIIDRIQSQPIQLENHVRASKSTARRRLVD